MKNKKISLALGFIIIVLLVSIIFVGKNILDKGTKELKVAKEFIEDLYYSNVIDYNENTSLITEEVLNKSSSKDSKVKYSVIIGNYGVDIDSNYNVLAFSNKNIASNSAMMAKSYEESTAYQKEITEDEVISLAEGYLSKISDEKFKFKEIKNEEVESPVYKVAFYKYKDEYKYYKQEINISINKSTGKLEGYTNYPVENMSYIEEINITKDEAEKILKNNYKDLNLDISINDDCNLAYINISDKEMVLAYVFNIKNNDSENQDKSVGFVRADNGELINNTIEAVTKN